MKFALHNYGGKPVRFFTVDSRTMDSPAASGTPAPSHHIAVIDVSGSMWHELDAVKSIIEKVFTAEEFNDPSMKISLITYSSSGDVRIHFSRVTVEDVLAPNSPHLAEIRGLRVRGLTCMSQALVAAETLIDDAEATCISLHTDGYANDRSPYQEAQIIASAVDALAQHPNAFCNTVGYRSWCDFALLSAIANRLSGKSMQAANAREVYQALHASQSLLAGSMSPIIDAPIGDYDFVTFVSKKARKVLGSTDDLSVRGLSADDDTAVYYYREVDEATYNASTAGICGRGEGLDPIYAYCRAQIALGNLNAAKYAMVSTRVTNLIGEHARALVASEVAAMASRVEQFLFEPTTIVQSGDYGLGETGPSLLSLLQVLDEYKGSLRVNARALAADYTRRGLKKVPGKRAEDGSITPPTHKLQTPRENTAVPVSGIDINRDTATVNIRLVEDGTLMETATGNAVEEVAGIKLDLKSYRNYTLVGDGQVNVPVLRIKTNDKRCFAALKKLGVIASDSFIASEEHTIDISKMPLVDYDQDFGGVPSDTFDYLAKVSVLQKILSGLTSGESEALSAEQIAELKGCYITPALYFSPPSTTPYADLAVAQATGEVDTYLSYKVKVGTPDITNLGKLKSGNAYLQRRFTLTDPDGAVFKKPTLKDWWADGNVWSEKALSARTKLDGVDDLSFPIYRDFLGLGDGKALQEVLRMADIDTDAFLDAISGGMDRDEAVTVFKEALGDISATIDNTYAETLTPLAFYVGSTGLVPDSFGAAALTPDQLVDKHPGVKLAKAEKEGTFYELPGGTLLSVFVKGTHFSTESGVKAASALSAS
jgi:hypothetical protein